MYSLERFIEFYDNVLIYHSNFYFMVMPLVLLLLIFFDVKALIAAYKYVSSWEASREYSKEELKKRFIFKTIKFLTFFLQKQRQKLRLKINKTLKAVSKEIFIDEE